MRVFSSGSRFKKLSVGAGFPQLLRVGAGCAQVTVTAVTLLPCVTYLFLLQAFQLTLLLGTDWQ